MLGQNTRLWLPYHRIYVVEKAPGRLLTDRLEPVGQDGVVPLPKQIAERGVFCGLLSAQDAIQGARSMKVQDLRQLI